MSRPLALSVALSLGLAATFAPAASADGAIDACVAAPSRACVLDAALAKAAGVADPALHASVIAFIAGAQQREGLNDAASANLARAITETKALSEPLSERPRASIAIVKAEMGDFATAQDEARAIKSVERRIMALSGVAMALQRHGRAAEAGAAFEQAIGAAQSTPDNQRVFALINIARAEAKAGRDDASAAFGLAVKAARDENSQVKMAVVAMQQAEAGEFVQAFVAIEALEETGRNVPLERLAAAEAKAGKLEEAAAVATSIPYEPSRVAALAAVSVAESRAGQSAKAMAHIQAARQAIEAITDAESHAAAAAALAGALGAANLAEDSNVAVEAARQAVEEQRDAGRKDSLTAALSLALARAGRANEAIEAASRIGSPAAKLSALVAIAGDREAAKADSEALSALLAIPVDDARTFNLAEFASRLPR